MKSTKANPTITAAEEDRQLLARFLAEEQVGGTASEQDITAFERALSLSDVLMVATGRSGHYQMLVTWSPRLGRVPNHIERFACTNGTIRRLPYIFRYQFGTRT